ncbi:MAG: glycine oxidase ThiO [Oleiphilaceae bacterium]|nr:glycine oxidase ThiO [Oleiphilaceae bacterium]
MIVGGGVMGLMQARELALKGWQVTLLDKSECGKEASWAGGGIISPLYPWRYAPAITALASWSQQYYPHLIQNLEAESDIDPELSRHGLLMLAVDDYQAALDWAQENAYWLEQIDRDQLYRLEPSLREGLEQGLWMSQVASVRNPRLLRALKQIATQHPQITVEEVARVTEVKPHHASPSVVTEQGRHFEGDVVLLCSGAWTAELLGLPKLPIEPVKGQMLVFDAPTGLVNRVVLSHGKYVIPRRDGKVVAGSTLERCGFDKTTTADAKEQLADAAIELFPELARCPISYHWAGLRPGSPKGLPFIGALPEYEGVFVNAGHFRNGLVLAPASVRLMTSILCGETPPVDASPYDPKRVFSPSPAF